MTFQRVTKFIALGLLVVLAVAWVVVRFFFNSPSQTTARTHTYVALGDSYTFGTGINQSKTYPELLTRRLQSEGVNITLHANISKAGWTTRQLIDQGLQGFINAEPDFGTLLIGANDWIQTTRPNQFRTRVGFLMDEMIKALPSASRLAVITIPDFSKTPAGKQLGGGRSISDGINQFNEILIEEANERDAFIVDIFEVSQGAESDASLIAEDGLHASEKMHELWAQEIFDVSRDLF